jgi:hypothetical protein
MRLVAALALTVALGAAWGYPASAANRTCRYVNQIVQPGHALCMDGYRSTCLPNGAWAVDRRESCMSGVSAPQACPISAAESAAAGARTCRDGRISQCDKSGHWLGRDEPC